MFIFLFTFLFGKREHFLFFCLRCREHYTKRIRITPKCELSLSRFICYAIEISKKYCTKAKLLVANDKLYVEENYFGGEKKLILIELSYGNKDIEFVCLGVSL